MLCLENTPMSHSCVTAHGFSDPDLSSVETEPAERLRLFPLQFTGLSVTSGADQLVVLHSTSQDDILLCLQRGELCPNQDRVGELVGSMVDHFTRSVLGEENKRKVKKSQRFYSKLGLHTRDLQPSLQWRSRENSLNFSIKKTQHSENPPA